MSQGLRDLTSLMETPPEFQATDILKEETLSTLSDHQIQHMRTHSLEEGINLKIPEINNRKQQYFEMVIRKLAKDSEDNQMDAIGVWNEGIRKIDQRAKSQLQEDLLQRKEYVDTIQTEVNIKHKIHDRMKEHLLQIRRNFALELFDHESHEEDIKRQMVPNADGLILARTYYKTGTLDFEATWKQVQVKDYDPETHLFTVVFESSVSNNEVTKKVTRLNLVFEQEDPLQFVRRVERAR